MKLGTASCSKRGINKWLSVSDSYTAIMQTSKYKILHVMYLSVILILIFLPCFIQSYPKICSWKIPFLKYTRFKTLENLLKTF